MRAALLQALGEVPQLAELPDPDAPSGMSIVEVKAAALNPIDLRIASGGWYGQTPPTPYVPGSEGVGALPDSRRVRFVAPGSHGAFAERCAVDPRLAIELPDGLGDELAACLGIAGLAAWLSLQWRARLQPGESVLVLGASGPVGLIAVQAAKLLGAGRVVAAARNAEGLSLAASLGADATVNLTDTEDLPSAFREAAGGGVDVTIDPLWGAPAAAAAAAASKGGRLVQLGESAGAEATLTSASVRGNMLSILGYSSFDVPPGEQADAFRQLAEHAAAGRLQVEYDSYPLDAVGEAWERQQHGAHRKLLLIP